MKRSNKILSIALVLLMVVPMLSALVPLAANATNAVHQMFSNMIDFEDATAGTLTEDYVNGLLSRGFSATSSTTASDVQGAALRSLNLWTVAEEQKYVQTAGTDTADDTTDDVYGYVSAGNGNQVIRQTTAGKFPLFTIWDETGILFDQPFEYSFDIFARSKQVTTGGTTGASTGLVHFCYGEDFASGHRMNLVGMTNSTTSNTPITKGDGNFGTTLGYMTLNTWVSVRVRVYPATGRVIVWVDGKQVNDSVLSGLTTLYNAADHTKAGIAIGWNYGQSFDFDLDNISLCSVAETADISEHIDFTDARITASTEVQTLVEYLTAYSNSTMKPVNTTSQTNYSLLQDATGGWVLYQNTPQTFSETERGIIFKDATNLSGDETVTIQFDFKKNSDELANAYNAIRLYDNVNSTSKIAPLSFRTGNYISTGANGYAALRKTDAGYVQATMAKDTWYSFKTVVDLANATFQVYMNEGRVTDTSGNLMWEPLYYFTKEGSLTATKDGTSSDIAINPKVYATAIAGYVFDADSAADSVTTTASFSSYDAIAPTAAPTIYFMYGTSNAWQRCNNEAYMDNLSIKTADGDVDVSMDFTPEITNYPANTDWWGNGTFQNADAKKGGAKLSDWQVVDAPAESATYGKVIQPKANLGSFCFNDTEDLLPSYVFDVSFDLYMTQQPSSNIHLLKLWAPYTATDAGADATLSTVVLNGGQLMIFDTNYTSSDSRKSADIKTYVGVDTWYNLRVRFDLLEGYYRVYLNGRHIHTQNILEAYPTMDLNNLKNLHFAIHNHWGSSVLGYHYLDNVRVETVEAAKRNAIEFTDYEVFAADFEDSTWLTSAKAGEIPYFSMNYTKSSIIANADVVGNHALCLTGTVGGAMSIDMLSMGGYDETFVAELSVSYGNLHGSALDLAVLSDKNLADDKVLLSVMGTNSDAALTDTLFFDHNGSRYYLCDSSGELYTAGDGNAEATTFIDVAIIVDATRNSYAVYVNQKPAYYRVYGAAGKGTQTPAANIPLEMSSGKTEFNDPILSLAVCSDDASTVNKVLVDDVRVTSVKNGLAPVVVGWQENHSVTGAIRFLATVDTLYYQEIGFEVTVDGVTKERGGSTVYSSVVANGTTYTAAELDGRYITALIVSDITEAGVTFTVKPYVVFFGERIYGKAVEMVFDGEAASVAAETTAE